MKLNFGQEVLVLPASVLSHLDAATPEQLRVLLWLASDLSLVSKHKQLAKLAGCDVASARGAVDFWCACGLIGESGEATVPAMSTAVAEAPVKKKLQRADELPNYTSVELAELLEARASVRVLIDEAQQILGKIFNPNDVNIMVGMLDYLGIEKERTRVEWVSAAEGAKFAATMNDFAEKVAALGENKRLEDLRCKK